MDRSYFTVSKLPVLVAVVCFVLAACGVHTAIGLVPLGLAIFTASFLVP